MISKAAGEAAFSVSFLTPKSSSSPPVPPGSLSGSPVREAVECNNECRGLGLQTWVGILTLAGTHCATLGRMPNLSGRASLSSLVKWGHDDGLLMDRWCHYRIISSLTGTRMEHFPKGLVSSPISRHPCHTFTQTHTDTPQSL